MRPVKKLMEKQARLEAEWLLRWCGFPDPSDTAETQFETAIEILETLSPKGNWYCINMRIEAMQIEAASIIRQIPSHLLRENDAALIVGSSSPYARVRRELIPILMLAGTELALRRVKGMQVDEDAGVREAAQDALKAYESMEFKKAA
jgi:hypothetical protein